jgi:D-alanyl-D-alanine carboxypeptidase/D-alanyl-D-alanine-endopeptidase (penicillin-binding protein 4)
VLLSGWVAAAVLGWRCWEKCVDQPIAPRVAAPVRAPVITPPATPVPEGKAARIFREWVAAPQADGALVGFCLLDENGATLYASPLAATALCPASALKILTTGAALALLGPEFRFTTTLAGTAPVSAAGLLDGDLILTGGGDPTLSLDDLTRLADAARATGLKRVTGRVRIDTSTLPPNPMSDHWNWGDIGNAYGAGAFGVNLEHNRLDITFEPAAQPGAPAKFLGGGPAPRDTTWENHVLTGLPGSGDGVTIYSQPHGRTVTLRGTVPAGESSFTVSGANPDPPALAAEQLRARLEAAGVKFGDRTPTSAAAARTTLATHRSPPLPEVIDHIHRVSDNLEAQCLFLTLGQQQGTEPADAVRQHWENAGVQFTGLRLLDGSGLARANMIRPLDLARVAFAARRGAHGERFRESLSTYAGGAARAKIGGMSGVKTQVGYLRTAAGRDITFCLMANGLPVDRGFWARLGELLQTLRTAEL